VAQYVRICADPDRLERVMASSKEDKLVAVFSFQIASSFFFLFSSPNFTAQLKRGMCAGCWRN
jgi:hypothetical protein